MNLGNRFTNRINEEENIKLLDFETEMLQEVFKKSPDRESQTRALIKITAIRKRVYDILIHQQD